MGFLLSPRIILALVLAGLLAVIGMLYVALQHQKTVIAQERAGWAQERTNAAAVAASASEAYRAREQAWAASAAQIQSDGEKQREQIAKRAADLDRTIGGLRGSLAAALNAIRSRPTEAPAVTEGCAPARETASMLAGLSDKLATTGAVIARHADEAYAASVACVSSYEVTR